MFLGDGGINPIMYFPYSAIFCLNLYLVTLFHIRITLELYFPDDL